MSKPITKEQARENFLAHIRQLAFYWSRVEDRNRKEMCEGMAFSILTLIDGSSSMPSFDLVLRPHEDDKAFRESEDDDYYVDGMVINDDVMMHEIFYPQPVPVPSALPEHKEGT